MNFIKDIELAKLGLRNELIMAYEDILRCKYVVESWGDMGECHSIPNEAAIKIAHRLLQLKPHNQIANHTLDIQEGLLLVHFTNNQYHLLPQMEEWNINCGVKRHKLVPRHITTLDEALKFVGWGEKND